MENHPKFCTQCGAPLPPEGRFCTQCGAKIAGIDETPDTSGLDVSAYFGPLNEQKTTQLSQGAAEDVQAANANPAAGVGDAASNGTGAAAGLGADVTRPFAAGTPVPGATFPPPNPDDLVSSTTPMPAVAQQPRQYRQEGPTPPPPVGAPVSTMPPQAGQSGKTGISRGVIVAIVAVAVVIVLGIAIGLGLAFCSAQSGDTNTSSQSAQLDSSDKTGGSSSSSSNSTNSSSASSSEQTVYNELSTYYSRLSTYNDDIADAATTFNNKYLLDGYSERTSASEDAYMLYDEVCAAYDEVQDLNVPTTSINYSNYLDIQTCYYDCKMRIEVICEAWERSMEYSDPSDHQDYICEPLSRDKVNGTNKYLTDFKSLYPSCKPVSPTS